MMMTVTTKVTTKVTMTVTTLRGRRRRRPSGCAATGWLRGVGAARRGALTQHIKIYLSFSLFLSFFLSLSVAFALTATATQVFILQ
jgi:hypothetical protein